MSKKLIKNKVVEKVNHKTWTRFTGWCRMNGILVGDKLTEILDEFLKDKVK